MTELVALLVTPLSRPLAGFGLAGASALRLWAAEAADLPHPWRGVRVEVHDAHPDPAVAMRRGLALRPHLVFGPYGSGPTLQALGATERVVWNHGGADSRIGWPAFPGAVNVLAPASSYFRGTLEAVRAADPQARSVVMFHAKTGFGSDIARGAAESAADTRHTRRIAGARATYVSDGASCDLLTHSHRVASNLLGHEDFRERVAIV